VGAVLCAASTGVAGPWPAPRDMFACGRKAAARLPWVVEYGPRLVSRTHALAHANDGNGPLPTT
jgi:hypothetical protein